MSGLAGKHVRKVAHESEWTVCRTWAMAWKHGVQAKSLDKDLLIFIHFLFFYFFFWWCFLEQFARTQVAVICSLMLLLRNSCLHQRQMGFAVRVRSAGQKYGPTCHQRDHADITEFVTLVRLSSLGQHVGVLALAGYKRRKSALTAGPIVWLHP